jgi:hypothetical protein
MRIARLAALALAASLALQLIFPVAHADAAAYDSLYQFESAFLGNLKPGDTGTFSVFFANTGTTVWAAGAPTQVNLAVCAADKVTCNVPSPYASWNPGTWISATAYATHAKPAVAPGDFSAFTYNVMVPASATAGVYRFNGDLVVASTGTRIHPEGYYQEATVQTGGGTGDTAPTDVATQVGSFDGGATNNDVRVFFTAPPANTLTMYDIQRAPGHCGISVDSPFWFTIQTLTLTGGAFGAYNDLDRTSGFWCYQVRLKNASGAFVYSKQVEATVFGSGGGAQPVSNSVILNNDGSFTGTLDTGDQITISFSKAMSVASSSARIRVVDADCGAPASQSSPPASCTPQTTADIICGTNASCVLSFDGLSLTITMTANPLTINPGSAPGVQFPADITESTGITDLSGQVWTISTSPDRVFGPLGQ